MSKCHIEAHAYSIVRAVKYGDLTFRFHCWSKSGSVLSGKLNSFDTIIWHSIESHYGIFHSTIYLFSGNWIHPEFWLWMKQDLLFYLKMHFRCFCDLFSSLGFYEQSYSRKSLETLTANWLYWRYIESENWVSWIEIVVVNKKYHRFSFLQNSCGVSISSILRPNFHTFNSTLSFIDFSLGAFSMNDNSCNFLIARNSSFTYLYLFDCFQSFTSFLLRFCININKFVSNNWKYWSFLVHRKCENSIEQTKWMKFQRIFKM